jgi:phospho-N-acetylmuramoyl-pentapeptide-transferase
VRFGAIGFWDDYVKIAKENEASALPLAASSGLQIALSLALGLLLYFMAYEGMFSTRLVFPFFMAFAPMLGLLFRFSSSWSSPVRRTRSSLTDGLDGLAIGSFLIASRRS